MIELKDKDFEVKPTGIYIKHKLFNDKQGLVMFKAEWCGYCQRAKPELSKASDAVGTAFPIAMIDCDKNKKIPMAAGIVGYPTIKYVNRNGKLMNNYEGPRKSDDILDVICKKAKLCKKI